MTPEAVADRLNSEGAAFLSSGDRQSARSALRRAMALAPSSMAPIGNYANLLSDEGSPAAAAFIYRRALAIAPMSAALHLMLGTALLKAGDTTQGERSLAAALKLQPGYPKAYINLGVHKLRQRQNAEAERNFRLALAAEPLSDLALAGLSQVLTETSRSSEALAVARRAVVAAPSSADALSAAGQAIFSRGRATIASRYFLRAFAAAPGAAATKALMFCSHYDPEMESDRIFSLYRRWAALQSADATTSYRNSRNPERKLRIGYLSADLYDHPVGRTLIGLVEHHDPSTVEAYFYSEPIVTDRMTDRFRAAAKGWRSTLGQTDQAVAGAIREDEIDILVVLAGHTPLNRISVAVYKPAPVQVSMYDFSTTGLFQMDYFLTDADLTPEGVGESFSELPLKVPSLLLHPPIEDAPLNLRQRDSLVFGSSNNPAKLNDRVIALWARLLAAIPGAQLRLKYRDSFADVGLVEDVRSRLLVHGISSGRVEFNGRRVNRSAHLSYIADFDIALDPFPFNGCTTTYEALWMGIPVITMAGKRFVGRFGVSMLKHVGLSDLVAADEESYIAAACELAADHTRRISLRHDLRRRLKESPLLDAASYARSVETAYRDIWRHWCHHSKN